MSLTLILIAIIIAAASGLPGLCIARSSSVSQRIAMLGMCSSAALGLAGAFMGMFSGGVVTGDFDWQAAGGGIVGVDALSAFFLLPVFLMGSLGAIYGLGYWPQRRHADSAVKLQIFWGLLTAGMALLVVSRHAMVFLLGWEAMAIAAFFLITADDTKTESCRAGWVYLIATHFGTLGLFGMFILWRIASGSYMFAPAAAGEISTTMMNVMFILAVVGFGVKAGIMPLQFWLPGAHANAPSHVSAVLSGVMLKMGVYGLVRFLSLFPDPPYFWGIAILLLGAVSGLLGVVFAIGQHDLKRLLAYHSVENIGIIMMGFGVALLGRSSGHPAWVVLGMAGCLLHVWNHSFFKSLLFFGAGSVLHAAHTREIDSLGGLAKKMPWTALMFLVGAIAICGLPPLNGFASELFVYLGLLRAFLAGGTMGAGVVMAVPVLAMIGALAVACFVKVYGAVFLGNPRTPAAENAHESPRTMRWPMAVLAVVCAAVGLAPVMLISILNNAIFAWDSNAELGSLGSFAPLTMLSVMAIILLVLFAILVLTLRGRIVRRAGTWDCGYARPTARMQYTASSFAQIIVSMFGWILRPHERRPRVRGLFPEPASTHSHVDELILDRLILPVSRNVARCFGWFRRFQQGMTHLYVLYIMIIVIVLLIWGTWN